MGRRPRQGAIRGPYSPDYGSIGTMTGLASIGASIFTDLLFNDIIPPPRVVRDVQALNTSIEAAPVLPLLYWNHGPNDKLVSLEQSGMGPVLREHGLVDYEPFLNLTALAETHGPDFYNNLPIVAVVRDGHVLLYSNFAHQDLAQTMQGNLTVEAAAANERAMQRVTTPLRHFVNGLVDGSRPYLVHLAHEAEKGEDALNEAIDGLMHAKVDTLDDLDDAAKYNVPILAMSVDPTGNFENEYYLLDE